MTRRRRILVVALALLPAVTAAQWARSHWRRDRLTWESDRGEGRRIVCHLYSSRGRVCFASYSRPVSGGTPQPWSFQSGDRASTAAISEEVNNQLMQAGIVARNALGFAYSQHVGSMSSGTHVWTGAIVPWWAVTLTSALPACVALRRGRERRPEDHDTADQVDTAPAPPQPPEKQPLGYRRGRPPPRRPKSY